MEAIKIFINDLAVVARKGQTILETAKENGISIPTLCHLSILVPSGNCRICVVEVVGKKRLVPACAYPVEEGMVIYTHSERVRRARKTVVELLLANHPDDCLVCIRNSDCELLKLASEFGVRERRYVGKKRSSSLDLSSVAIERDPNKCVLCGRCLRACIDNQQIGALNFAKRGFETTIDTAFNLELKDSECVYCGQCVLTCPTGALRERSALKHVWAAIHDPGKKVIALVSPAAKIDFLPKSESSLIEFEGQIIAALKRLGFDYVFDLSLANDIYQKELAKELLKSKKEGRGALISSFCPSVVKLIEQSYPELVPNLSQIKSPQQIAGALIKREFSQTNGFNPEALFVVAIRPCTAAKYEAARLEMSSDGLRDVDAVLTTRELLRMLQTAGVEYESLTTEDANNPFINAKPFLGVLEVTGGLATTIGAGTKEGLEKELLSAKEYLEKTVKINDELIHCLACDNLGKANKLLSDKAKLEKLDLVEVHACPGGCLGGGGLSLPAVDGIPCRIKAFLNLCSRPNTEQNIDQFALYSKIATSKKSLYQTKFYSQTLETRFLD